MYLRSNVQRYKFQTIFRTTIRRDSQLELEDIMIDRRNRDLELKTLAEDWRICKGTYVFESVTSSTPLSKAWRGRVVVEVLEDIYRMVSINVKSLNEYRADSTVQSIPSVLFADRFSKHRY